MTTNPTVRPLVSERDSMTTLKIIEAINYARDDSTGRLTVEWLVSALLTLWFQDDRHGWPEWATMLHRGARKMEPQHVAATLASHVADTVCETHG